MCEAHSTFREISQQVKAHTKKQNKNSSHQKNETSTGSELKLEFCRFQDFFLAHAQSQPVRPDVSEKNEAQISAKQLTKKLPQQLLKLFLHYITYF
jgi:hypothetical protein